MASQQSPTAAMYPPHLSQGRPYPNGHMPIQAQQQQSQHPPGPPAPQQHPPQPQQAKTAAQHLVQQNEAIWLQLGMFSNALL